MATMNERTLQMKQNYMKLHSEGHTPKEIAREFGLSLFTVYHYLGEIADENGVTRESLLEIPHNTTGVYERQFEPLPKIDYNANFEESLETFKKLRSETSKSLKEQEEITEMIEKEEELYGK